MSHITPAAFMKARTHVRGMKQRSPEVKYIGPTEASRRPRRTPWLFRRKHDLVMIAFMIAVLLAWIWF